MTDRPFLSAAIAAVLLIVSAAPARATGPGAAATDCAGRDLVTRVFEVHFKRISEAVMLVDQLLGPCGTYRVPKALGVIAVEDEQAALDRVARALESWDVPPATVEVTVSLILATREPPPEEGIRAELRDVSETLSRVTRWTHYERIGSATLHVVEGGTVRAYLGERYRVSFRVDAVDADLGVVRLEPFDLLRLPHPSETSAGLRTPQVILANSALNVFEGRLNLVGAGSRERDRALFVALEVWPREPRRAEAAGAMEGD